MITWLYRAKTALLAAWAVKVLVGSAAWLYRVVVS